MMIYKSEVSIVFRTKLYLASQAFFCWFYFQVYDPRNVSGTYSLVMRLLGKMHMAYLSGWWMFIEDMSSRANVHRVFFDGKCL